MKWYSPYYNVLVNTINKEGNKDSSKIKKLIGCDIARFFLNKEIPERKDCKYIPLLHMAVTYNFQAVVKALLKNGADPDVLDLDGWTPLQVAVIRDLQEVVKILLESGADINAKNNKGNTALHLAVSDQNLDMIKILLENGADSKIKNREDNTSFHLAVQAEVDKSIYLKGIKNNALLIHDRETKKLNIKNLINRQIHEPHQVSQKLKLSCNVRIIETLLKHDTVTDQQGASINEHNYAWYYPIHLAVQNNNLDAAEVLLSDPRIDVNVRTRTSGETALMLAVRENNCDIVKLLLNQQGIDYNKGDFSEYTAFDLALQSNKCSDEIAVTLYHHIVAKEGDNLGDCIAELIQSPQVDNKLYRIKHRYDIDLRPIVSMKPYEPSSEEEYEPEVEISEIEVEAGPAAKRQRMG